MDNIRITPQMLDLNVPTFFSYSAFCKIRKLTCSAPDIRTILRLRTHSTGVFTGRYGEPNGPAQL